jgi:RNA polymerase sigma-70 factor (ECF subfamily)
MHSPETASLRPAQQADAALVRALLDDHPTAWRRFVASMDAVVRSRVLAATCRGALRLSDEDRAEIRANLFASLLAGDKHKLRAFDPQRGVALTSWIGLLAEHCATDYVRALRAQRTPRRAEGSAGGEPEAAPSPEDLLGKKQRVARLLEAARTLPPRHRELFDMYYADGLAPEAIAARMGTSVQTVHSARHKIEQHLVRTLRRERPRAAAVRASDGAPRLAA